MNKTKKDVSGYIDSLPVELRQHIRFLDQVISSVLTGHARVLWEGALWGGTRQTIIGYGDYTFTGSRGRKSEWFLVGLAAQKQYLSIYVNAVEGGRYAAEIYRDELGKVKVGKSSISFKGTDDLNLDTLRKVLTLARDKAAVKR